MSETTVRKFPHSRKDAQRFYYRIDWLQPNMRVRLFFATDSSNGTRNGYEEDATFLRIEGKGHDRHAVFESADLLHGGSYEWEAYRYNKRWVYGTGADRLSLVDVITEED